MNADQKKRIAHELSNWANVKKYCSYTVLRFTGNRMAALLQELVDAPTADTLLTWTPNDDTGDITDTDGTEYYFARENAIAMCRVVMAAHAPEAEPFGYFKSEPFGWTDCAETDDGAIALYTAPSAPSVPDGWIRAIDEAMVVHHIGIADRADGYEEAKKKLNELLAINSDIARYCSEPPADVARDAALYCAAQRACAELPEGWEIRIELERSAGTVILVNPDGEDVDYSSDHEYMASDINAAIDAAIEREILGGGNG